MDQCNQAAHELESFDDSSTNTDIDMPWSDFSRNNDKDDLAEFLHDDIEDTTNGVAQMDTDTASSRARANIALNDPKNRCSPFINSNPPRNSQQRQQQSDLVSSGLNNNPEASNTCPCVDYVIETNEAVYLNLVWPSDPYSKYGDELDDTLQCLKDFLGCFEAFLSCSRCRTRSELIMVMIPMCGEIIKSIRKLRASTSSDTIHSVSTVDNSLTNQGLISPISDETGHSNQAKMDGLTSASYQAKHDEEIRAIWYIIQLRTAKVSRLLQYLEKISQANRLPCFPQIRRMRASVRECSAAIHTTP